MKEGNPSGPSHGVPPTHEQIAALARKIWREQGSPEGSDIDFWLEAERRLTVAARPIRGHDPIPADPGSPGLDSDPALASATDREISSFGGEAGPRSPTSFGV